MKLLFLHHQQRFAYDQEPGYNELFRPFTKAPQVTGWSEFVYQKPLRQFLLYQLGLRGKKAEGQPTPFIMRNLDAEAYGAASVALLPMLTRAVKVAQPDLIVYSLTWATECIHPVVLGKVKEAFPHVKIFTQQWDYEEGADFFHSVESATMAVSDCFAICDSRQRLRRIQAREGPYAQYEDVSRARWLPTVPDPDIFRPVALSKTTDVLIAGSSEGTRRDVIAALGRRYGDRFRHIGGLMPWDKFMSLPDYAEAINRAKIVVNPKRHPTARRSKAAFARS